MGTESIGSPLLWAGFIAFVLALLALDLGIFHRKAHEISVREAAGWSIVWAALAGVFNIGIYFRFGPERALEFTTGYLIEKALAVDNIFVFVVIFSTFAIPAVHQHRILFWGVLGALVMRAAFILAGGAFLHHFHWAMYVFGGILALTGLKLLFQKSHDVHPEKNPAVKLIQRFLPVSCDYGGRFTLLRNGRRFATPLLLALVAVEVSDLIFAVDSIPAIFAITTDPFIVFTSNIFAILGLRSLFFLLAGMITKFAYLNVGLSFVLMFVGAKMLLLNVIKIPIGLSLGVIAAILGMSVAASLLWPPAAVPEIEPDVEVDRMEA
jgi:tellurite resistance protein TerC